MSNLEQVIIRAPEQTGFRNPEVIENVRSLREWLDGLPLLKPASTVQLLHDAIDATNRQPLSAKKRLPLMHEYRKVLLQINPSLNLNALRRLPLDDDQREQLQLRTIDIGLVLADGYKILIKTAFQEGNAHKAEILFEPLYLAMEALSLALLNCFRTYKSAPPNLYQDFHQLYLLAEHSGLLEIEIEPNKLGLAANQIGQLYHQTMTLAFLDPYHLPVGIADKLYERLAQLAIHIKAVEGAPKTDNESIWVTDLSADEAPKASYKISDPGALRLARAFDLQPMTAEIQAQISNLMPEKGGLPAKNESDLLRRLIPFSKAQLTRKSDRKASDRLCKVTFGIDAVHYFLGVAQKELAQVLDSDADRFGTHLLETWNILNESDTGLSLGNEQLTRHDIRVGDIIGLLTEHDGKEGHRGIIAIIRWIRNNKDNHINIGVEFIQGNLLPAICRLIDEPHTNNTSTAVFISSQTLGGVPATLLTPKSIYQRGRIMEVTIGDQPLRIKAGFLRDDSFSFDRFDFTSLNT